MAVMEFRAWVHLQRLTLAMAAFATAAVIFLPQSHSQETPPTWAAGSGFAGRAWCAIATFTGSDGCSVCVCGWDGRMSACSRADCPDAGNYTANECVENMVYKADDGCNECHCSATRRFDNCTRFICLETGPVGRD